MKQAIVYVLGLMALVTSCKKEKNENKAVDYTVESNAAQVEWKGYLANDYFNTGTFSVSESTLKVKDGKLQSGSFTIPIVSLDVLNLEGDLKAQLEAHLKSSDFFNALVHPEARFDITGVSPYQHTGAEGVVDGANTLITGNFTMLGTTKSISFPARLELTGETLEAEALFSINRLDWGMNYASDPAAGEHHIKPMVDLHLQLHAEKE
ncbi:MAG TPA: YceI family protein [Flavisolibacter sp.]|nr:YceI family protein [Flavisolibacter sp.]